MNARIAIGVAIMTISVVPAVAAENEMTSKQLLSGLSAANGPKAVEFAVQMVGQGLKWANADLIVRKAPPIFCMPMQLSLTPPQTVEMLRQTIERDPRLGEMPFGMALLIAFKQTYPCPAK
jgi:hypothetical protein